MIPGPVGFTQMGTFSSDPFVADPEVFAAREAVEAAEALLENALDSRDPDKIVRAPHAFHGCCTCTSLTSSFLLVSSCLLWPPSGGSQ